MRFKNKKEIREYTWKIIKKHAKFPFPVKGRIPNFVGARKACERLRKIEKFKESRVVFCAPDSSLRRAREITLEEGKLLLVAKPHLRGFLILKGDPKKCSTISGMLKYGTEVKLENFPYGKIGTFVQGCVAVDLNGNRVGKGSGYGDKEYALLKKFNLLEEDAINVVIAHDCQIFDNFSYLVDPHDVKAHVILTPTRTIWCK